MQFALNVHLAIMPSPECHQYDNALHTCFQTAKTISSMKTEQHDLAGRMITKALNKSPCQVGSRIG
eukprot:1148812-Pelagomonas_calceolata.AAC.17